MRFFYAMLLVAAVVGVPGPVSPVYAQTETDQPAADTTAAAPQAPERGAFATLYAFITDLFDISTGNLQEKALRILVIILIGMVARVFMSIVQGIGRFMVYSKWGPFKYLFRNHQRAITVQKLVISLIKYVIYFTALGYILSELGIDYRAYLASLSLIGIAIGFGSQGLVQDVVTGFFILFENQFGVGDMVEIAGQTGIVEDIGLRTTRLRNYFGGVMVFPNRNIAVVGRYARGGMEVNVDVALADPEQAERGAELLQRIGTELSRQFKEILLEEPSVTGVVKLTTGECFLRLYGKIWPGQQWVIDAQMVPRIKELFLKEDIQIQDDRVVTFYHLPDKPEEVETVIHKLRGIVWQAAQRLEIDGQKSKRRPWKGDEEPTD